MKFAVVTGAAGGIGTALCKTFRDAGWQVFGIDVATPQTKLRSVTYITADLDDDLQIAQAVHDIQQVTKAIHSLVNCAAVQHTASIEQLSSKQWDESIRVNVRAPLLLSQQLITTLEHGAAKSGDAAIINIGSVHANATSAQMTAYAASKAALHSLSRSLSLELGERGIRVNTIAPGAVETVMLTSHLSGTQRKKLVQRTPLHHLVQPADIATMALYLCSPQARHITGQEFIIDSGALAQLPTEVS